MTQVLDPSPLSGSGLTWRPMQASGLDTSIVGFWAITARTLDGNYVDLIKFRGTPTQPQSFSSQDPFGDQAMTILMPQITPFDAPGQGDLGWLYKGAPIQMVWVGPLPEGYPYGSALFTPSAHGYEQAGWVNGFTWNGYIISVDFDTNAGATITCTGTLYQLDNYQAKPEYPTRPYPYEQAIARCFEGKPHLKMQPMRILWPTWWTKIYSAPSKGTASYLVPQQVKAGDFWTGNLTRSTGQWEATLTSYIQTMLAGMYTSHGRWTLDVDATQRPLLYHVDTLLIPDTETIVVDPLGPGNSAQFSVDWSQTLDVVYGQGTARDGVTFTGMEVSSDGTQTYYEPMAYRRQAFPTTDNSWLKATDMPIEQMIQLQAGLNEAEAEIVAAAHLRQFADPGVTGTVTLATDPTINGVAFTKFLIRAGMNIQVPGLLGRTNGLVMHVTQASADLVNNAITLTVDSKFRDALTVQEVRERGRDAMRIPRMLVGGQYSPPVPDQLVPWNYKKGSGFIPSGKARDCVELFEGMPLTMQFPWTTWLKSRPPSHQKWRDSYIKIAKPAAGQGATNSNYNWAYIGGGPISDRKGVPIKAAQAATIRLTQVVAVYADGSIAQVPFHISFYWSMGVGVDSMPQILSSDVPNIPSEYNEGQFYPFSPSAWEKYLSSGVLVNPDNPTAQESAGLIRPYGTYEQMAGYWPGSDPGVGAGSINTRSNSATGMLVDETTWAIDTTQTDQQFNPYSKKGNSPKKLPQAGKIYAMVYCDQQDQDVYFIGRLFRVEPGTGS